MEAIMFGPGPADVREFPTIEEALRWWEPGCQIEYKNHPVEGPIFIPDLEPDDGEE